MSSSFPRSSPPYLPSQFSSFPDYFQSPPVLPSFFSCDPFLPDYVRFLANEHRFDSAALAPLFNDFDRFGQDCSTRLNDWNLALEHPTTEPNYTSHDGWGKRIDQITTHPLWRKMHERSAEEGLIAIGYERRQGDFSRVAQFVKLFAFAPNSAIYQCPLAMTDGAAKLIESLIKVNPSHPQLPELQRAYKHLTSRSGSEFWTSGQWMTEKAGGSDVSGGTRTIAVQSSEPSIAHLYGYKWFTSAIDADMSITLGRLVSPNAFHSQFHASPAKPAQPLLDVPLTCFLVKVRDEIESKRSSAGLNNISVVRLKEKLGTRSLPTAELELQGSRAIQLSEPGKGVALIAGLVNVTRIHNSISSASHMRKILLLHSDYTRRRRVFGRLLCDQPLHLQTLFGLEVATRAATAMSFDAVSRLGKSECSRPSPSDALMFRFLIPLAKLFTAKLCVHTVSEALEAFGGAGYLEDTGIPKILRDSQVFPVWEGTTNVLSHDVWRVIKNTKGQAIQTFRQSILHGIQLTKDQIQLNQQRYSSVQLEWIQSLISDVERSLVETVEFASSFPLNTQLSLELDRSLRDLAFSLSRIHISVLFLRFAVHYHRISDWKVAEYWIHFGYGSSIAGSSMNRVDYKRKLNVTIEEMKEIIFGVNWKVAEAATISSQSNATVKPKL